ncbi:hypothetical protein FKM82_031406 [Ascaphus truei]
MICFGGLSGSGVNQSCLGPVGSHHLAWTGTVQDGGCGVFVVCTFRALVCSVCMPPRMYGSVTFRQMGDILTPSSISLCFSSCDLITV